MSFSISLSGLRAARIGMDVSADNTANVLSSGFKKSRVVHFSGPPATGGVRTEIQRIDTPGRPGPIDPATNEPQELSNVDLTEEMVNMIVSERTFQANLQAIRAEDEMLGNLIDIVV